MAKKFLYIIITVLFIAALQSLAPDGALKSKIMSVHGQGVLSPLISTTQPEKNKDVLLAERVLPLDTRHQIGSVNDIFRDNILLSLFYMSGKVDSPDEIAWDKIRQPSKHAIILQPGEVFAFHDDVLPEYQGRVAVTTNAHFNAQEGFLFSGLLYGDGVCHLATIMNWAARDAGLQVDARVYHDFAVIPDVPREYGTSIITDPTVSSFNEQMQNLYITNTTDKPIKFVFEYEEEKLKVSVYSIN